MYDFVSQVVSLGYWRDWQRQALAELRGRRVLDLAFGTGNTLLDLRAAGYDPIGLDLSPAMIRITKRKLHKFRAVVPLTRGRAQQLPFADASFDSILCTFPARFIVDPGTLDQLARVLCPGGRIVVVALSKLTGSNIWVRVLRWLYRVTGQRTPLPELESQVSFPGLTYKTIWKSVKDSAVLLVVFERRVDDSPTLGYTVPHSNQSPC